VSLLTNVLVWAAVEECVSVDEMIDRRRGACIVDMQFKKQGIVSCTVFVIMG